MDLGRGFALGALLALGGLLCSCASEPACLLRGGEKCVTGSSYAGEDGELYCIANGGKMVDACPTDGCIGKCLYDSHATWYYTPAYTVDSAEKGCTNKGSAEIGTFTTSCP